MPTFADNLARLEAITTAELALPRDLADWACRCVRELGHVRQLQRGLSPLVAKSLRDQRIAAATRTLDVRGAWPRAQELTRATLELQRNWSSSSRLELPAGTRKGELQAAHRWYALPDSDRTFFRLLTKTQ